MFQAVLHYVRPPPLRDLGALRRFLSGEASYLAQRSTYEFSRNTLAWFGQWAFGDDKFNDAFRFCRWEAFAAVLADMTVLTHDALRATTADDRLADRLVALYEDMLLEYPLPAHRPAGWNDLMPELGARLRLGVARGPAEVAVTAARRIYDVVPVRSANLQADYQALEGAIRFGMVSFHDRLRQRLRADQIVPALLDEGEGTAKSSRRPAAPG
jgi:hypothetical protein